MNWKESMKCNSAISKVIRQVLIMNQKESSFRRLIQILKGPRSQQIFRHLSLIECY